MGSTEQAAPSKIAEVIQRCGQCLELVSMDAHFHNVTIGLYVKDGTCTVWSFSRRKGLEGRIERIRDQMVTLGGMEPVAGTHDQFRSPCGQVHVRPVKFLLSQAVGKAPDFSPPSGEMRIRDTKSKLELITTGNDTGHGYVYEITAEGEAPNIPARLRMVVAGFVRYGEMDKVSDFEVAFPCRQMHDGLMRILIPYSRNISAVESMMEEEAMRGQMTTSTLGFSQT